jgi:predicted aldo/keto reductase-like oxidoreductase
MEMPRRVLGPTGLEVTIIGVGGFHMAKPGEKAGIKIIRTAIDEGVNFLDNAWCYHGGRAEEIMGKALRDGYRERVVLMTKNHGWDYDTYVAQLSQSLARLQTDYIDLVQFHEIIHEGEPARIFNEGAIDAAVEARKDGKIGHIGFTGHRSPGLLQEMLSGDFDWEAVQMPVNLLDHHYRSFQQQIMPALQARGIGLIGMKSQAGGGLLKAAVTTPEENIRYSLSRPIATLVSGMDSLDVLRKNLQTAREFEPLSEAETEQLLDVTKDASQAGRFENYKTRDD